MRLDLVFNMRVLIIGIESFTGKHLASWFHSKGYDIYGTIYIGETTENIIQCDITDKQSINHVISMILPDYIINLAGISYVGNTNRELLYKVNVFAVENILDSILAIKNYYPKKVLLASSAIIYGNQAQSILDETMCPHPLNHYGISKYAMEQITKTYFKKINIVVTRPFNYTGRWQETHFVIPKIVSHFKNKSRKIELGNIDVFREFNDVNFVCDIYERLLLSNINSEIVNVCSNRVIALNEVIEQMNKIAGYEIHINVNPEFIRSNEIIKLSGSTSKLFDMIGPIEQKTFKDTLMEMYND